MRLCMLFSRVPVMKPLAFIKSVEDARGYIEDKINRARIGKEGQDVPTAVYRWQAAEAIEIELTNEAVPVLSDPNADE